jgi:outer membrane protein OmpA-like peptidoglycan-associated protein
MTASMLASLVVYSASVKGAQPAVRIPFVVGLTTVRAAVTPQGDYESMRVIDSIDANGYHLTSAGQVPADDGSGLMDATIERIVRAEDQRAARKIRIYFHTNDPPKFPNTVPGFSAAMVNDLRTDGKTEATYLDVHAFFGMPVANDFKGTLRRVPGPATMPMLVNGRVVPLPVLHAKGTLSDGSQNEDIEFDVLDDPENPIVLRFKGLESSTQLIRIEYPEPDSIEKKLAKKEPVVIYGLYFDFAKANIRKQSERVLNEIASVMREHPDWKLRIDGHTDSVGNDAANLDLSKRRAAAVKDALVTRYKIDASRLTTGGSGESSPIDTNDTPEGRARNRRVELRRE